MRHSEDGSQGVYPLLKLYAVKVQKDFNKSSTKLLKSIFPYSESFFCTVPATSQCVFWRTKFHSI